MARLIAFDYKNPYFYMVTLKRLSSLLISPPSPLMDSPKMKSLVRSTPSSETFTENGTASTKSRRSSSCQTYFKINVMPGPR